jgi:hypothetical protein
MKVLSEAFLCCTLCLITVVVPLTTASGEESRWTAIQLAGIQRDCSSADYNVHWRIVETDRRITLQEDSRSSSKGWRLDAGQLNPDGSGRINIVYHNGRPAWFEFAPGRGPRTIYFNHNYHACVWQLHPA